MSWIESERNCAPCKELNRLPYGVLVDLADSARGLRDRHPVSNSDLLSCALFAQALFVRPQMPVNLVSDGPAEDPSDRIWMTLSAQTSSETDHG
jgi:hypothetical protein